jgi:phosphoribosylformylglycinamidine synthase
VPRIVVDVMLKPEILDPQGQAIVSALPTLQISGVRAVRQGKHFELDVEGDDADALRVAEDLAGRLLANPVIEDYRVRLA